MKYDDADPRTHITYKYLHNMIDKLKKLYYASNIACGIRKIIPENGKTIERWRRKAMGLKHSVLTGRNDRQVARLLPDSDSMTIVPWRTVRSVLPGIFIIVVGG